MAGTFDVGLGGLGFYLPVRRAAGSEYFDAQQDCANLVTDITEELGTLTTRQPRIPDSVVPGKSKQAVVMNGRKL